MEQMLTLLRDMMSIFLRRSLDEKLGYSNYDYQNKTADNSHNGYSQKTMYTSYDDMDVSIPRDNNSEYEPQPIKKYQNTMTQDIKEKSSPYYAKGITLKNMAPHMKELHDMKNSDSPISRLQTKILSIVRE